MNTFFSTQTAPQYATNLYLTSKEDYQRWDAAFDNRLSYTKEAHGEVKQWVAENIERWKAEGEAWFKIEMIPDAFFPSDVLEEEGGARRRRTVVSVCELLGRGDVDKNNYRRVAPTTSEER